MSSKIIISMFVVFIPAITFSQDEDFEWLIGKWRMDSKKSESYEEWQKMDDRISGQSYKINNGQKVITENLFIEKFAVCKLTFTFTSTELCVKVSRFIPHADIQDACPLNVPN